MSQPTSQAAWACVAQHPTPLGTVWLATRHERPDALAGLWFEQQKHFPANLAASEPPAQSQRLLDAARRQLDAYFAGQRDSFDIALAPQGSAFQQKVWQALLGIGYGALSSYGELASSLGYPQGARAVGSAVGRNPISIIIPCHRVVGRHGSLTGYAGGLERKMALLSLEERTTQPA